MKPTASRPHAPGYGIVGEDAGDGLLPWSFAEERLERTKTYFLTTVAPDGRPHVMPLWGLWLDDAFWFSTDATSRKGRNLAANPSCVVVPDGAEEAVIVEGEAHVVAPDEIHPRWREGYLEKYGYDLDGNPSPVFRLAPRKAFGLIERTFTTSATRWTFA